LFKEHQLVTESRPSQLTNTVNITSHFTHVTLIQVV